MPDKKIGGYRARLSEKENFIRYRAQFEGNLLLFARARAHVRAMMTRKSCAVGMRNAILRNYLKRLVTFHKIFLHSVVVLLCHAGLYDNTFSKDVLQLCAVSFTCAT